MTQHRRIQKKIAGRKGKIEVPIRGKKRADVVKGRKIIEIERSGNSRRISLALSRLKAKKTLRKELRVPQKDLGKAVRIAKKKEMKVVISNISGTKKRKIK